LNFFTKTLESNYKNSLLSKTRNENHALKHPLKRFIKLIKTPNYLQQTHQTLV